jgi:hypothetical protein
MLHTLAGSEIVLLLLLLLLLLFYWPAESRTRRIITDTAQHQTQVKRPVKRMQMKQT